MTYTNFCPPLHFREDFEVSASTTIPDSSTGAGNSSAPCARNTLRAPEVAGVFDCDRVAAIDQELRDQI